MNDLNKKIDESTVFASKTTAELITLDEEIEVVGLSFHKCNETGSLKLNDKFDLYNGESFDIIDTHVKNIKKPRTAYAVWANSDVINGIGVTDISGQDEIFAHFTIPAGRYMKISWNAETFSQLVMEAMGGDNAVKEAFLKENNLVEDHRLYIEVYPESTIGKHEKPITPYPEMYNLFSVKDKE